MVTVLSIESGAQYVDMTVDMVHLVILHVIGMSVMKGMYLVGQRNGCLLPQYPILVLGVTGKLKSQDFSSTFSL